MTKFHLVWKSFPPSKRAISVRDVLQFLRQPSVCMAKRSYINQLSSRKRHKYAGLHLTLPSLIVETRFDPGFQHVRLTVPEVNWTVRLNRAGSQLKFRRGGGGIWSLMKRSGSQQTIQHICIYLLYLFREGGGFDPLWRLDSPARKRPRKNMDVSAGYQDCLKAGYSPYYSLLVSPESSVFGGCRSSLIMFDLYGIHIYIYMYIYIQKERSCGLWSVMVDAMDSPSPSSPAVVRKGTQIRRGHQGPPDRSWSVGPWHLSPHPALRHGHGVV